MKLESKILKTKTEQLDPVACTTTPMAIATYPSYNNQFNRFSSLQLYKTINKKKKKKKIDMVGRDTLGATTVAALTTRLRKDLWVRPPGFSGRPADEILTVEGLSPSNDGKLLVEIAGAVAITCNSSPKTPPLITLIDKMKPLKKIKLLKFMEKYPPYFLIGEIIGMKGF